MSVKIMPISDLRRKTSDVIQTVQESGDAVYITQHGRPIVVLVEYERYENLMRELHPDIESEPPGSYTDYLAGLHSEIWEGIDTDEYLEQERDSWLTSPKS
jgi:prevent-host-death family protein